ncbi:OmpA family protein [Prevotella sp. PINT]|jgi:Outer membrane protein and related peptidoglycan-associated (lipo)proteins|uniref:OmpA family protein n=1 Tax=Palleniella intestinalis TaxID=2736291 RepID=UPI001555E409|nr:OmpA family protein [Palleniella intestinalis]NPD81159.1 OmpA family protein [Palleniella intestinalis]
MKKIISLAASVAFLLGMSTVANAQETKVVDPEGGHYFIGIKGGAQATLTHYNFTDLVTPQYGIYFGKYFNQYLGVRLDVTGYQNKGGFKASRYDFIPNDYAYKFNAGTADIDLLFNMTNIINPKRVNRSWNWNLLAGFGMNYTWERDEFNAYVSSLKYYEGPHPGVPSRFSCNGRVGTQVEYNFSKNFSIMFEADANYKNDQYNLKFNDQVDWQVQAFIGITYKFGHKTKKVVKPAPEPAPVVREEPKPVVVEKKEEPKPVVKAKETTQKEIFFKINKSEGTEAENKKIAEAAEWLKAHPTANATVKGYADKGTGNAKINARIAKKRADNVAKKLTDVYGIDASRLEVSSYGDTVQPKAANNDNRLVIIVAAEQ